MTLSRRRLLAAPLPLWALAASPGGSAVVMCGLVEAPSVLIPGLSDRVGTRSVGSKLYRGLCRLDAAGRPQPDLAASWDVSPDGRRYRFHLLPGLTWHDGAALGANDVVFSIDDFHRALNRRLWLKDLVQVHAEDARTVAMTLAEPFPAFLRQMDVLTAPIVPEHVHAKPGWGVDPQGTAPIGAGPFRYEGWLLLSRFDGFVGPRPTIERLAVVVPPDDAARLGLAQSGTPMLIAAETLDPAELAALRQMPNVVTGGATPAGAGEAVALLLNRDVAPLRSLEARRGLAAAVDAGALLWAVWSGLGRVSESAPVYSTRDAAAHFQAAGLRPGEDGVRARLRLLLPRDPVMERLGLALVRMVGLLAIDLVAETVELAEWQRRLERKEYEVAAAAVPQTGDATLDAVALERLVPTPFDGVQTGLASQARQWLVEQAAVVWLVAPSIAVVRDRRLQLPGGLYGDFSDARVE